MGGNISRARTTVNSIIDAGIDVVIRQVQNSRSDTVAEQNISCIGCKNCKISHVSMKQFIKVDFSVVAKQMSSSDVQQKIDQAVKTATEAVAKAGFPGLQITESDSETAIKLLLNISQHIAIAAESAFVDTRFLSQTILCKESTNVDMSYIDLEQSGNFVAKAIVSQDSFNTAMMDIVSRLEALSSAKSEGWDPGALLVLIAIAVVIGIFVFMLGGVTTAKDILTSPYFWIILLSVIAAIFAFTLSGEMFGFWPHLESDHLDKEEEVNRKKRINTSVTVASILGMGVSLMAAGGITYIKVIKK